MPKGVRCLGFAPEHIEMSGLERLRTSCDGNHGLLVTPITRRNPVDGETSPRLVPGFVTLAWVVKQSSAWENLSP